MGRTLPDSRAFRRLQEHRRVDRRRLNRLVAERHLQSMALLVLEALRQILQRKLRATLCRRLFRR